MNLDLILEKEEFTKDEIIFLLSLIEKNDCEKLRQKAFDRCTKISGNEVFYRGIVEFSNICALDCNYCGIRKSNRNVERYFLSTDEVVDAALWCGEVGYGSAVLQSGERQDEKFISFVVDTLKDIKCKSISEKLPRGLGITLSVGEQTEETYQQFFNAGAHRYLLRIETTNDDLFKKLHPEDQKLSERKECLNRLKKVGFQVGTGVMIGIPGQTVDMLADDIIFFKEQDIDMIGMGPYIVHEDSPIKNLGMMDKDKLLQLSFNMIAVTRLILNDVNIAATTALQALVHNGREVGISYGANVTMPNLTPREVRKNYQLYEGKPCIEEGRSDCRSCLQKRVESVGRVVGWDKWGDSLHFAKRQLISN